MILFGYRIPNFFSLIIWGCLWELVGQSKITYFVPSLSEILKAFLEIYNTEVFLKALFETAYALVSGLFFAIFIGIPLGVLMGKNRIIDECLLPWVNVFLSAPLTALVPVLMVLFGFGLKSIIITTTLFAIWIIMLNARAGVLQINRSLVEMANSYGSKSIDAFFKIYI